MTKTTKKAAPLAVLVACKEQKEPGGLEHLGAHRVYYDTSPGWGAASNNLLDKAAALGGDCLFVDDDVILTPESLDGVKQYYDQADCFGLDLHDLSGQRQAGARHAMALDGTLHDWVHPGPAYIAHASTSAMYIKHAVLAAGIRFPIWPGLYWEDVALCLAAWLHGFKVLAVPGYVHHDIVSGSGATKRHSPEFWAKERINYEAFRAWCDKQKVGAGLADGRIPVGAKPL